MTGIGRFDCLALVYPVCDGRRLHRGRNRLDTMRARSDGGLLFAHG
jgi:hypothetical protein